MNGCCEAKERTRNVNVGKWKRKVRLGQGEKVFNNEDNKENWKVNSNKRAMQLRKDEEVQPNERWYIGKEQRDC